MPKMTGSKFIAETFHGYGVTSVFHVPYLASWNFRHLVRVRTRREVSLINVMHGYEPIEIVAPPEL